MSDHRDWVHVAAVADYADAQLARHRAEMAAQLAALREEWNSSAAHHEAATEALVRQRQEDHLTWLRARAGGQQDVVGAGSHGAVGASPPPPGSGPELGHRPQPQQQLTPPTPHEMAAAIKDMDLGSYAQLRAELGIGSAGRGLLDS